MSAVVEAPAAPAAFANDQPGRQQAMAAIDQADARLADAKATLARATAAQDEKASALNAARTKLGNVLNTRTMETAALAQAQSELVPAVLAGADHDEVRQRAQDAQTKIDALEANRGMVRHLSDSRDVLTDAEPFATSASLRSLTVAGSRSRSRAAAIDYGP